MRSVAMKQTHILAYIGLLGARAGDMTEQTGTSAGHLHTITGTLSELLAEDDDTSDTPKTGDALVQSMDKIFNEMRSRLYAAHNQSVSFIQEAYDSITACSAYYNEASLLSVSSSSSSFATPITSSPSPWYENYFNSYAQCRSYEEHIRQNLSNCTHHCLNETQTDCPEIPQMSRANRTCTNFDCSANAGESYPVYLARMISELEALQNTDPTPCHQNTTNIRRCFQNCEGIVIPALPDQPNHLPTCCYPRLQAETSQCENLKNKRFAWLRYSNCYEDAVRNYDAVVTEEQRQAIARQAQMRAVKRMMCLGDSFGPNQSVELPICIQLRYANDTDVLAMGISADPAPAKKEPFNCSAENLPGTSAYDSEHYSDLPAGLEVCPEVHCEAACNTSSHLYISTLPNTTTTASQIAAVGYSGMCYRQSDVSSPMFWSLEGLHSPVISAVPGADVARIDVYLHSSNFHPSEILPSKRCGAITASVRSVNCTWNDPTGGYYLVLNGHLNGDVTVGSQTPSWCALALDGSPTLAQPMGGGISYAGR